MCILVFRVQLGRYLKFAEGVLFAKIACVDYAQIEVRQGDGGIKSNGMLQEGRCTIVVLQVNLYVAQVGQGKRMLRIVSKLGTKLDFCFIEAH